MDRVASLIDAGTDMIATVDTAQPALPGVIDTVRAIRVNFGSINLMAGNVATGEAVKALAGAGADCVKVGIGPWSICTTCGGRGGSPAVDSGGRLRGRSSRMRRQDRMTEASRYSGDITKALAAGANAVMIGKLLAGTGGEPGRHRDLQGTELQGIQGHGLVWRNERGIERPWLQQGAPKARPGGDLRAGSHKGTVSDTVYQLMGGVRAGMGYVGAGEPQLAGRRQVHQDNRRRARGKDIRTMFRSQKRLPTT